MVNAVRFCKALLRVTMIDEQNLKDFELHTLFCSMEVEFGCSRNCKNEASWNERPIALTKLD